MSGETGPVIRCPICREVTYIGRDLRSHLTTHRMIDLYRLIWSENRPAAVAIILGVLVYIAVVALAAVELS